MRWCVSRLAAALLALALPAAGLASSPTGLAYGARVERYVAGYSALIPKYAKVQFAGGIGLVSVGLGWDYGKGGRWETDVLIGVVPRMESNRAKMTFTVRECLVPWDVPLGRSDFSFAPLRASLGLNSIIGHEFWPKSPNRYPDGYYFFSTKFQVVFALGQQVNLNIADERRRLWRSVGFFYELSTNDKYVLSGFGNRRLGFADVFHVDLGVKLKIL